MGPLKAIPQRFNAFKNAAWAPGVFFIFIAQCNATLSHHKLELQYEVRYRL